MQKITNTSPFKIYEGDKLIPDGAKSIPPKEVRVQRYQLLAEKLDFQILEVISELGYCTSKQITEMLNLRGITCIYKNNKQSSEGESVLVDEEGEVTHSKVQSRLNVLKNNVLVTRYRFSVTKDEKGESKDPNIRAYVLQHFGSLILSNRGIKTTWDPGYVFKTLVEIKKILLKNNVLVAHLRDLQNVVTGKSFKIRHPSIGQLLEPVLISLKNEKEDIIPFFFEAVRNNEGYKAELTSTVKDYLSYFRSFAPTKDIPRTPRLVLIGEDELHLADIYNTLEEHNLTDIISKGSIMLTTDNRASENLREMFVQIKKEEDKIKYTILKSKLYADTSS